VININIDLREIGWNGMNWIDLAQDRDQWRALVNTIMNLRVAAQLAPSQEGLSSMSECVSKWECISYLYSLPLFFLPYVPFMLSPRSLLSPLKQLIKLLLLYPSNGTVSE
jgi:hypothetical protein